MRLRFYLSYIPVITHLLFTSTFAFAAQFIDNPVKKRLQNSTDPVFGGYVSIPNSQVIENIALPQKLNFVWIEALQTTIGPKEVQDSVIAAENEGLVPIVRVPKNDPDEIKKFLGTGVLGIIVPRIHNKEEAQRAISAIKYPPEGSRPPGVERANRYMGRLREYSENANKNILVIFTLDNKEMVKNIDEILSVKGIDILHIGPLHLSSSLGVTTDSPELASAISKAEDAARKMKIPLGGALPSFARLDEFRKRGFRFFTVPADMELLRDGITRFFNGH